MKQVNHSLIHLEIFADILLSGKHCSIRKRYINELGRTPALMRPVSSWAPKRKDASLHWIISKLLEGQTQK